MGLFCVNLLRVLLFLFYFPMVQTKLGIPHLLYVVFFCLGAVAFLLLLAVALLCAYELCAVYVTAGTSASQRYSPSGFFFGVSAIALAINMLFICRMVFNGNIDLDLLFFFISYFCLISTLYMFAFLIILMPVFYCYVTGAGFDVDEYVRRSYKFAYSDCIEVGPLACLPEPPDPHELYTQKYSR